MMGKLECACHSWAIQIIHGNEWRFCTNKRCAQHVAAERELAERSGHPGDWTTDGGAGSPPGVIYMSASPLADNETSNGLAPDAEPTEVSHDHRYSNDFVRDRAVCSCGSYITGENLAALGFRHVHRDLLKSERANMLADVCQVLKDENTQLLAENARLRRKVR